MTQVGLNNIPSQISCKIQVKRTVYKVSYMCTIRFLTHRQLYHPANCGSERIFCWSSDTVYQADHCKVTNISKVQNRKHTHFLYSVTPSEDIQ